jgi:hypothetical protein
MEFTKLDTGGDIPACAPPPQLLPSDKEELDAARGCRFSTHPFCAASAMATITSSSPPQPKTANSAPRSEEAKSNGRIPTETTTGNRSNETPPYESSGSQIERPEGIELGDSGRRIDRRRGEMARREGGREGGGTRNLGGVKRASFSLPPSTVRLRLGVGRVEGERGCFQKTSPVEGQTKRNTRINY